MRVGLVLGAGGVMGGAWLTGALAALADETGWDPASADRIVGTSAGSMMAALLGAGIPPWFMVAFSAGEQFDGLNASDGRPADEAHRGAGSTFRLHLGLPRLGPGSPRMALGALLGRGAPWPRAALTGLLPEGLISTQPLADTVRRVVPEGWAPHPSLWVMACDYESGRRVAFGGDAPAADLAEAVAASCAIPGFYRPVRIGGRRYVDGGACSPSNLDVLAGDGLDLVICLNPTSSLDPSPHRGPAELLARGFRNDAGRMLGREARMLRAEGTDVVLIQPSHEDLAAMGTNLMRTRGRNRVIETARRMTADRLREAGVTGQLAGLPKGHHYAVRRPEVPPHRWDALREEMLAQRTRRVA